ncbi:hypothetical protein GCM10009422_23600 [Brevundimonas kwangchunensis]|uniref:Uncharacterized protein n=1 Tax=Brevundimonas kwangchunensis TaxID=322163 RepID=A0ABP3S511_9CAUL
MTERARRPGAPAAADKPLEHRREPPIFVLSGFARTMAINVPVISGPDPGAIPGGSTILSRLSAGERGAD